MPTVFAFLDLLFFLGNDITSSLQGHLFVGTNYNREVQENRTEHN